MRMWTDDWTDGRIGRRAGSTVLAAPIVWWFGFLSPFRQYTLRKAYANLSTVLTIVHFESTHPIHYMN